MSIFTLSYHSRNRIEDLTMDSLSAVNELLSVARSRNQEMDISGALFFNAGRFVQVLEGDEAAVRTIFKSVEGDPRHDQVTILSFQESNVRRFKNWSMAFVGKTSAARHYYASFIAENHRDWESLSSNALCKLMLELIELDERESVASLPNYSQ